MIVREHSTQIESLIEFSHAVGDTSDRLVVVVAVTTRRNVARYEATAFAVDLVGERRAIVNEDGQPLIAFGNTPLAARACLMSALRRRGVL